jgi:hypothetical protein
MDAAPADTVLVVGTADGVRLQLRVKPGGRAIASSGPMTARSSWSAGGTGAVAPATP